MTARPRPSHPAAHGARRRGRPRRPSRRSRKRSWTDELVVASLGEIVHARSGDKGGDANLGVWVRDSQAWEWLRSTLTVDELRRLLPETRELAIERYELPNLGAINFLIRGLLGTGATSSLRLDAQAKALGEWLRARSIKVPTISCRSEGTDERTRREHHRRRPQGHPRAGPQLRLRVLAAEGQARRIPVGVRQGVRPGRMARRAHPRGSTAGWGSASRSAA